MSAIIPAATNRSLLGTIGGVIGAIGGFIGGGPGGAVAGATAGQQLGNAISGGAGGPNPPAGNTGGASSGYNPFGYTGGYNSGGSTSGATPATNAPGQCAPGVAKCNPCGVYGGGSHLNTRTLMPSKKHGLQPPGTWCVRRRHMNATNFKALRRADRRAHAFLRISKRVTRHYVAKQPKGRGYVHFKKRSR